MSWSDLHTLARDTFGVVTPILAARAGIDRTTVLRRARREGWANPHPGVLLLPGTPDTEEVARSAALQHVGAPASLSHDTAADQHGFGDRITATVHVTVPANRRPTSRDGIEVHRSTTVRAQDLRVVGGLPTLAVARTLRDLAPRRSTGARLTPVPTPFAAPTGARSTSTSRGPQHASPSSATATPSTATRVPSNATVVAGSRSSRPGGRSPGSRASACGPTSPASSPRSTPPTNVLVSPDVGGSAAHTPRNLQRRGWDQATHSPTPRMTWNGVRSPQST